MYLMFQFELQFEIKRESWRLSATYGLKLSLEARILKFKKNHSII